MLKCRHSFFRSSSFSREARNLDFQCDILSMQMFSFSINQVPSVPPQSIGPQFHGYSGPVLEECFIFMPVIETLHNFASLHCLGSHKGTALYYASRPAKMTLGKCMLFIHFTCGIKGKREVELSSLP